ncbi:hypothetical protein R6X41_18515 [Formosa sp. PL04]|nr:hypothetical protein [Formosa sp. PL04]
MTKLFTLLLFLLSFGSFSQTNTMNNTKPNHSKIEFIAQADSIINTKYPDFTFNPQEYEITVWFNTEMTLVKYRRIIKFTPLDKKEARLKYNLEVNLTTQAVSPFDTWGMDRFYIPTEQEQAQIDFVITSFGRSRFGFNNTIIEDTDMYRVTVDNDVAFGKYFLDKTTGKESMGSIEGSYAPMPDLPTFQELPDPLVEITK